MTAAPIQFLFDYISPYAYLASTQIRQLAARHGREVQPVPVLFAGLLNAHGTRGPAEVPAKRRYVFFDAARSAAVLGVPIVPPPTHPFNPLLALRVTCAEQDAPHAFALIDALYRAVWGSGAGAETAEQVGAVVASLGLDAADVLARAGSVATKQRLRDNTDRAIAAGAFGVPTMLVDESLFWGLDSLAHLDRYLAGEETLDREALDRWLSLAPSASRPQAG